MMLDRAVINSGPLIALSLLGRLDILPLIFKEFWIPDAVYQEVAIAGIGRTGADDLRNPIWQRHIAPTPELDPLLIAELDIGEASVIALARKYYPCMAIIDEKRGRHIAQHVYQLPVKGSVGLLVEAARHGEISDLRASLMTLKQAGYSLSDAVIEAACSAVHKH